MEEENKITQEPENPQADFTPRQTNKISRPSPVLSIDGRLGVETEADKARNTLLDLVESLKSRRILTGTVEGIERGERDPEHCRAVLYHGDFKVIIPAEEMVELPEDLRGRPQGDVLFDLLNKRMGAEVDYVVKGPGRQSGRRRSQPAGSHGPQAQGVLLHPGPGGELPALRRRLRRGACGVGDPAGHLCGPVRRGGVHPSGRAELPADAGCHRRLPGRPAGAGEDYGHRPDGPGPHPGAGLGEAGGGEPLRESIAALLRWQPLCGHREHGGTQPGSLWPWTGAWTACAAIPNGEGPPEAPE